MPPKNSEKYTKTVIAYANTQGGKLVFGVLDETREIVGIDESILFQTIWRLPRGSNTPQLAALYLT